MSTGDVSKGYKKTKAKLVPQCIAALTASLGSFCAGIVFSWTGNITEELKTGKLNNIEIDDTSLEWIGSLINIGGMFSCLIIVKLSDWIGRKKAMLSFIIPFTLGWLLIIFARNTGMIYAGRFITGFAAGGIVVTVPLYISETSEKHIRGRLGTFAELCVTSGVLTSFVITYLMGVKSGTILLALSPILFGIIFFLQPETPVYMVLKGKEDEALKILCRLRGQNYNVTGELEEIKDKMKEDKMNETALFQALRKRESKIAALVIFGLFFFQQVSAVNVIISYASELFGHSAAADKFLSSSVSAIIVGTMQVIANIVSATTVDKLGRRLVLTVSGFFMTISQITMAIYLSLQDRDVVSMDILNRLAFLPILSVCVFIFSYEMGYGPIAWTLSAEVCPAETRSILYGGVGTMVWLTMFLVTKFYFDVRNLIGADVTFYIFGGFSFLGTLFPFLFIPETKGKSLGEIQRELRGKGNNHLQEVEMFVSK